MKTMTSSALWCALCVALSVSGVGVGQPTPEGGRHIVYINHNNYPSLLYINNANSGHTRMDSRGHGVSDIINLILYPADEAARRPQRATVVLQGNAQGTITLTQDNPPVGTTRIEGVITGLTPGYHGFHIHQSGDLSGGCKSAGGHYNPYKRNHGAPSDTERHVGDLGNIIADSSGIAVVNIEDSLVSLVGPRSVVGRAIVIHAGQDDLGKGGNADSLLTGNAGGRVGCGVIGHA